MNNFSKENIKMVIDFANEEYLKFAKKMFTDFSGENEIYIGLSQKTKVAHDEWKDEIYINVKDGKGVITGSNLGSVVIAMYRFLRELVNGSPFLSNLCYSREAVQEKWQTI